VTNLGVARLLGVRSIDFDADDAEKSNVVALRTRQ